MPPPSSQREPDVCSGAGGLPGAPHPVGYPLGGSGLRGLLYRLAIDPGGWGSEVARTPSALSTVLAAVQAERRLRRRTVAPGQRPSSALRVRLPTGSPYRS